MRGYEHTLERVLDTFEGVFSALSENEVNAHEKAGAYKYIPLPYAAFVDQLDVAMGLETTHVKVKFIDIGCGIGTKLLLASSLNGSIIPYGIELNPKYGELAKELLSFTSGIRYPTPKKFNDNIILGDARKHDFSPYDILYFYCPMLDQVKQIELETQIYKTAKKGALILANMKQVQPVDDKKHRIKLVYHPSGGGWCIYRKL